MMGPKYIILIFLLTVSFPGYSQNSRYNQLIGDNSVYCMEMDKQGILWIGTEEGLIRYNSKSFKYYHYEPRDSFSLLDNSIRSMFIDSEDRIWLGTRNGLNLYNREKDNFLRFNLSDDKNQIKGNFITSIVEDQEGYIWIASESQGMRRLNPKTYEFTHLTSGKTPSSIISNNIEKLAVDESGSLWVGTREGLDYIDIKGGEIIHYYNKENIMASLQDNDIITLCVDKNGFIWNSGRNGYLSYLDNKDEFHSWKNDFTVTSMFFQDPFIYMGTDKGKLYSLRTDSLSTFAWNKLSEIFPEVELGTVRSIFVDPWQNVWTGTENGLFVRYSTGRQFTGVKGNTKKLPMNAVRDLYVDRSGKLWLVNKDDVYVSTADKVIPFSSLIKSGNQSNLKNLYTVFEDSYGYIWFGTFDDGLFRFNPVNGNLKNYRHDPDSDKSLPRNCIWTITEDLKGDLWIGSWGGGLIQYDRSMDSFSSYRSDQEDLNSLSNDKIISVATDSEGIIWVGTDGGGLNRFNPLTEKFVRFTSDHTNLESITDNSILSIFEDSRGQLWIGTDGGGLLLMDKSDYTFKAYNFKDGLLNSSVKSIQEDRNGMLWLSTNGGGIFLFIPDEERFIQFTSEDGLSCNRFYAGAVSEDRSGNIYFGGVTGYTTFNPMTIELDIMNPEIHLTGISINNEDVSYNNEFGLKNLELGKILTFKPSQKILTLDFAAIEYSHSDRNKYRYKIIGYIDEWNYLGEKSSLSFMNLPAGNYELLIQCSNMDGIWNPEGKSIELQILPPFYQTPWFIITAVLFIISLIVLWNKMRMRELRNRQVILQEMVEERTREVRNQSIKLSLQNTELEKQKEELAAKNEKILKSRERLRIMTQQVHEADEMKLRFFTNISHEFRTPLTLILGPLENLINRFKYDDQVLDHLLTMRRNAGRLLRLIGQIMEFRKLDTGKLRLKASYGDISSFSSTIIDSFKEYAGQKKIELVFRSHPKEIRVFFDDDKMDKILYNLLSNAIRFTPENGRVELNISEKKNIGSDSSSPYNAPAVCIRVSDNGKGIPADEIDHIFERFYQVKNPVYSGDKSGAGVGLALTKSLVSLHKGIIEVKSVENKGSVFEIYLPMGKSHLMTEEIVDSGVGQISGDSHLYDTLILPPETKEESQNIKHNDENHSGSEKIKLLIIEDNLELRKYLYRYFSDRYKVLEAGNGDEGLKICTREFPDIVISDIIMPEMDGLEFCNNLKNDPDICHIPVILLTAKSSDQERIEGLEKEADAYITKPFSPLTLAKTVQNLLDNRKKLQEKYRRDILLEPENVELESNEEILLRKAMQIVEDNISNSEFNVNIMSREIGVSRAALYRKLKVLTNQSVNVFVRNIRLKRAAQLLGQNKVTISEVAYMVGYNDVQYFRKCFTKHFKLTPSQYISKLSENQNK